MRMWSTLVELDSERYSGATMQQETDNPQVEQAPSRFAVYLHAVRAPFLTASLVPVLLGTALAFYNTNEWNWPMFLCSLFAMIFVHGGANAANDYYDHLSGGDAANTEFAAPFTGGSRMIQQGHLSGGDVLRLSLICFAIGGSIGLFVVWQAGWPILVLGLVGAVGGYFYSAPPFRLMARGLGELVIGLNFGILPVLGAYYAQAGKFTWSAVVISIPTAVLVISILFINQFQDYKADAAVGKNNIVVRIGRKRASIVYILLMVVWAMPIVASVLYGIAPRLFLIALLPLMPALRAMATARTHFDDPVRLTPANGITIACHLVNGLLAAAALIVAGFLG